MSGKAKIVLLGVLAALILLPSFVQTGPTKAVYLTAIFRDMETDRIQSDGQGPYQNASNITVLFDESGNLQFIIGDRAARKVFFFFGWTNRLGEGPCPACPGETWPDTTSTDPDLANEPTTYVSFRTNNGIAYAGPHLDFPAMTPGQTAPVHLGMYFETKLRKYFKIRFYNYLDPEEFCDGGGPAWVTASDMNRDGVVDRWVISPVPDTGDKALLHRIYDRKGWHNYHCTFGYFTMPFELVLDRK